MVQAGVVTAAVGFVDVCSTHFQGSATADLEALTTALRALHATIADSRTPSLIALTPSNTQLARLAHS